MSQPAREDVFEECLAVAAREGAGLAALAVAEGSKSLVQAAVASRDPAERARLADAGEALHRSAGQATGSFAEILRDEMSAAAAAKPAPAKALSFDALELMAEDQVDDTVEIVRAQQAVMAAVEADLVQLNALMSAVQGRERVDAASNPLRPEVWVRALHRALGRASAAPAVRALWMNHASRALGPALAKLYQQLSQRMAGQGVSAAVYRIAPPRHETRRIAMEAEASRLTLRDLKRLLVNASRGNGDTPGLTQPPGQTMSGMTVPAAMEALQGMKRMDDVVKRMQERWRQGTWQPEAKGGADADGAAASFTPAQTLAREVVRLMVANVAADPRLLPEVQQAVRTLEPALLRLVLHDQRFFSDRKHPARELLEEMTQRSLVWPQRNAPGFAEFMTPVAEVAKMLAEFPLEDSEPFDFALQTLRQSWAEAEERTRRHRSSMARTLMKADARNHEAAAVSSQLRQRPDVASAPAQIRRFLLGPWSQVMAAAKLKAPDTQDAGGYGALVNDIVWISQPRLTAQNPARLEHVAAPLLQAVRTGLELIGYPEAQIGAVLARLVAAQEEVPATAPPVSGIDWDDDAGPWLSPRETGDSRLLQETDFAPTADLASMSQDEAVDPPVDVGTLEPGHFIEVLVRGQWARWRLSWASAHGSMLMFTDAGGRAESMTRQMLARMAELGAIRLLPTTSVVDGALNAVAQAALENSTQQQG